MSSLSRLSRNAPLACCAATLAVLCPRTVPAQTSPLAATTYPAALESRDLRAWLKKETDISPETVVAISPLALIAIMQTQPVASPEGYQVTVRAEILDPSFATQQQLLSWHATIKLACADRAVSVGEATGHTQRNLLGEGRPVEVIAQGWKPVIEGTMQEQVWNARCSKTFKPPLMGQEVSLSPPIPAPPRTPDAPIATVRSPPAGAGPAASATPPPAKEAHPTPQPAKAPAAAAVPAAPVASAPAQASPPSGVKSSAQILAAPTAAEAERALTRLRTRHADLVAGLRTGVVAAQTGTTVHHRAIVWGFKAAGDATRFCQKLTAAGGKCLVRGDAGLASGEHAPQP
jgi:hypothetical protein